MVEIADKILAHGADYLLALKGNQPTLEADVAAYFRTASKAELVSKTTVEKGHGRIETRTYTASGCVDWILSDRAYPGQPRFTTINTILKVEDRTEHPDRTTFDTRFYISSAALDIDRLAKAAALIALWPPLLAVAIYGLVALLWLLPDRRIERVLSRSAVSHRDGTAQDQKDEISGADAAQNHDETLGVPRL